MFEEFILNYLIVDGDILDGLEEWDFNTQVFQFSQNVSFFWGLLTRMDRFFKKRRLIGFRNTLILFLFNLLKWRWRLVIWKQSSRPEVDFLNLQSIGRVGCLSNIDLLCLLVVRVQIWLCRHLRLLRWSRVNELWLRRRWRQ